MFNLVDQLANFLSAPPGAVMAEERIGVRRPVTAADLPCVAIQVQVSDSARAGLSRFLREGNVPAKNTAMVKAIPGPESFTPDLKSLQLQPLPVRRNPASGNRPLSALDVGIRNLTQGIVYQLTGAPARQDEYRVDLTQALIIFGKPQQPGDQLEVTHWTLTFREDIRAQRLAGQLSIETWASQADEAVKSARLVEQKLDSERQLLGRQGLLRLEPAALDPLEIRTLTGLSASTFQAAVLRLSYRFTFETTPGGELSGGGVIRQIQVDVDNQIQETFSIP